MLHIHSPHTVQTNQNEAAQSSKFISPSFSGPPSESLSCNLGYLAHLMMASYIGIPVVIDNLPGRWLLEQNQR